MNPTALLPMATSDLATPIADGWQLTLAALLGIGLIVVLITVLKLHPFLSLLLGGITVGLVAGMPIIRSDTTGEDTKVLLESLPKGFGDTMAGVGILVALGAMFAKLLADSGAADRLVETIVDHASPRALPWAMALVGAVIGLPMFFEIGLVLLMPVIYLVARRSQLSLVTIGIPTLAGLSAMHGLVPPHPGPLLGIEYLGADLGTTLMYGVLVAIPTVLVSGPLFGRLAGTWVDVPAPTRFDADADGSGSAKATATRQGPGIGVTLVTMLLPIVLMMGKAIADITIDDSSNHLREFLDILGTPLVALLLATLLAMVTFGLGSGMDLRQLGSTVEGSLPGIAGILLIVAAGGAFKQVLVDTGVGTMLGEWATDADISIYLLGWLLAVLIRLATGSATIATITASTLMTGVVVDASQTELSLVVLAVGAGSVFFSHVNDAGFWLVKEYFGLDVPQTLKTWSLMETVLSVTGLVMVLAIGAFV